MALVCLTLLTAAACGAPPRTTSPDRAPGEGPRPAPSERKYRATGTVLQKTDAGSTLCLGGVLDSLPPQCGGIPIAGWDWDAVSGEESASGTTWGDFDVIGFYDGEIFTLVEARPARRRRTHPDPITSACPEPPGGWERPDPALTSEGDRAKAIAMARSEPDFAGAWIDYIDEPTEFTDPQDAILNLAFTDNLERHEREIRRRWGGPLCVVKRAHTLRRLSQIRNELHDAVAEELGLDILWSSPSEDRNVVEIGVVVIDPAAREALDDRYGEGVVEVTPQLQPVR